MGYYIPDIKLPDFSKSTKWMSGLSNAYLSKKQAGAESNRIRIQGINEALNKAKISDLVVKDNTKFANSALQEIQDMMTNALIYEMDENGQFTDKKKEKSIFGPKIDDREFDAILRRAQELDSLVGSLKQQEQLITKDETIIQGELKNPSGRIDLDKSQDRLMRGFDSGYIPEDGTYIIPQSIMPESWTFDDKFRLKEQGTYSVSPDGNYHVYKDAPAEYKIATFRSQMLDPGKQRGMVDSLIKEINDGTPEGERALYRLLGAMDDYDPNKDQTQYMLRAKKMIDNYTSGDYYMHPDLAEAAIAWGEMDKQYWKNIAQGYSVSRPRESDSKKEEETKPVEIPTRTINFLGLNLDEYTDVTNIPESSRRLNDYRLSSGAIKAQVMPDGKRVAKKNPEERNMDMDYIVTGWDEKAGWIRIKNADGQGDEEEYMIPFKGNENIVNRIKKIAFGKSSVKENDTEFQEGFLN